MPSRYAPFIAPANPMLHRLEKLLRFIRASLCFSIRLAACVAVCCSFAKVLTMSRLSNRSCRKTRRVPSASRMFLCRRFIIFRNPYVNASIAAPPGTSTQKKRGSSHKMAANAPNSRTSIPIRPGTICVTPPAMIVVSDVRRFIHSPECTAVTDA